MLYHVDKLQALYTCPAQYFYATNVEYNVTSISETRLYYMAIKGACDDIVRYPDSKFDPKKLWAARATNYMRRLRSEGSYTLLVSRGMKVLTKLISIIEDSKVVDHWQGLHLKVGDLTILTYVPLILQTGDKLNIIFSDRLNPIQKEEELWLSPIPAVMRLLKTPWAEFSLHTGMLSAVHEDGPHKSDTNKLRALASFAEWMSDAEEQPRHYPIYGKGCDLCYYRGACRNEYRTKNMKRKKRGGLSSRSK